MQLEPSKYSNWYLDHQINQMVEMVSPVRETSLTSSIQLIFLIIEIQLALDQVFIARVLNKSHINITVQTQTFPKLYQQESVEAKQV